MVCGQWEAEQQDWVHVKMDDSEENREKRAALEAEGIRLHRCLNQDCYSDPSWSMDNHGGQVRLLLALEGKEELSDNEVMDMLNSLKSSLDEAVGIHNVSFLTMAKERMEKIRYGHCEDRESDRTAHGTMQERIPRGRSDIQRGVP